MKQKWFCEKCEKEGEVEYQELDGAFLVMGAIVAAHKKLSPDCSNPYDTVRVVNEMEEVS